MIYTDFCGEKISTYGMGTMRLPVVDGDAAIDEAAAIEMFDYALEHGVNYFDTAYGYHGGNSEKVNGKALARHERNSFHIATKFPGYNTSNFGKHEQIFAEQLSRLQTEYVDFYLLHNICESNIEYYLNEETYGTEAYFKAQKAAGKIRHLGFSTHATFENFKRFLDRFGEDMEFCQMQINYLDWDFQDVKKKVAYCEELGIPVVVMEPLRGGYLVKLSDEQLATLQALRPGATPVEWALRWLQTKLPNAIVLNGASSMEQMAENIRVFDAPSPLGDDELAAMAALSSDMAANIGLPCTKCHYCTPHCPMELDIPMLLSLFNEYRSKDAKDGFIAPMTIGTLPEDKRPSACIGCGACEGVCPQALAIPDALAELARVIERK